MQNELLLGNLMPKTGDSSELHDKIKNISYVGIDFGTSTTVISYFKLTSSGNSFQTEVMPLKQPTLDGGYIEDHIIPSVVAWIDEKLIWGREAHKYKYRLSYGKNVWFSFKMKLGIDEGPSYHSSELATPKNGYQILSPLDVSKIFFSKLHEGIKDYLKANNLPSKIKFCITVPASFEFNQRNDLTKALEFAGIKQQDRFFIDEPNSAFISFISDSFSSNTGPVKVPIGTPVDVLVFDFGAGTCDITVLEVTNNGGKLNSRNLSISKFEQMGGDDIDRVIVDKILYPQFLKQNDLKETDIKTSQYHKSIVPKFLPIAERLKIELCKNVSANLVGTQLPKKANSNETVTWEKDFEIRLLRATRVFSSPSLSYNQFASLSRQIFNDGIHGSNIQSNSIKGILNRSLEKAKIKKELIDLVLLIGGSSYNPYIQDELRKFFPDAEIEIPRDLQSHVSQGASLNSFIKNSLEIDILQPIISESVFIILEEGKVRPIINAGTPIPTPKIRIGALYPNRDGQKILEIPVCVSSVEKVLTVLELSGDFNRGDEVILECEISHDKLILFRASSKGIQVHAEPLNPLSNEPLSKDMLNEKRLVRKLNESASLNGGQPPISLLLELARHFAKTDQHLKAAELFESIYGLSQDKQLLTSICFHYACAGRHEQQREWARKAYELNPNPVNAYNYALDLNKVSDKEQYCGLMQKAIDGGIEMAKQNYGEYLVNQGNPEGEKLLNELFEDWYGRFKMGVLRDSLHGNLARIAGLLQKYDIQKQVFDKQREFDDLPKEDRFNASNLLTDTTTSIVKGD